MANIGTDPRGPLRTIVKVEETTSATWLTVSPCGHRNEHVSHFHYRVGDESRCFTCRKLGEVQP